MDRSPIRVLAIYPAFDVELNEMAMVWRTLCASYPVHATVLTSTCDHLKGFTSSTTHAEYQNLYVYRFASSFEHNRGEVSRLVHRTTPDLIFCAVSHNMPRALWLQKACGAPILLHNEYFLDDLMLVRRRDYWGVNILRSTICTLYRWWLVRRTARILCSNPVEFRSSTSHRYRSLRYIPWPHSSITGAYPVALRNENLSVYIGSISKSKGAEQLLSFYSFWLSEEPTSRLIIVGPAIDKAGRAVLRALKNIGGSRVEIHPRCSRSDAMELLQRAFFVLVPGERLGWGLIGDAWSNGTPILAFSEHYDLHNGENCLIVRSPKAFGEAILALQTDKQLWEHLSAEGVRTANLHTVRLVADMLFEQLAEVREIECYE